MDTRSSERSAGWSLTPQQLIWRLSDGARQFRERRNLTPTAAMGKRGEDLAHRYLRGLGYTVIMRNYRTTSGDAEIDIVARDRDITVFVEVKTRGTGAYGDPVRAIGEDKECNITRAARSYATRAGITSDKLRFDTVSIVLGKTVKIEHQQDAFFHGRAI